MKLAETKTINRETNSGLINSGIYDDGYLRVEHHNYYISCGQRSLKFPRIRFLIVSILARKAGSFVSAQELWSSLWKEAKPYNGESLRVHIYRLRHDLAGFGIGIEMKSNAGYRLIPHQTQN